MRDEHWGTSISVLNAQGRLAHTSYLKLPNFFLAFAFLHGGIDWNPSPRFISTLFLKTAVLCYTWPRLREIAKICVEKKNSYNNCLQLPTVGIAGKENRRPPAFYPVFVWRRMDRLHNCDCASERLCCGIGIKMAYSNKQIGLPSSISKFVTK